MMTEKKYRVSLFLMSYLFRTVLIIMLCALASGTMHSCHKPKGPSNPYLNMKTKPSQKEQQQNKKALVRGRRAYKKLWGDNRKRIFGRRKPPKE